MSATERVINDLNVAVCTLCNPKMLTPEIRIRIGQAINSATKLLEEQQKLIDDITQRRMNNGAFD